MYCQLTRRGLFVARENGNMDTTQPSSFWRYRKYHGQPLS